MHPDCAVQNLEIIGDGQKDKTMLNDIARPVMELLIYGDATHQT